MSQGEMLSSIAALMTLFLCLGPVYGLDSCRDPGLQAFSGSGLYNDSSKWSLGRVPSMFDQALIASGAIVTLPVGSIPAGEARAIYIKGAHLRLRSSLQVNSGTTCPPISGSSSSTGSSASTGGETRSSSTGGQASSSGGSEQSSSSGSAASSSSTSISSTGSGSGSGSGTAGQSSSSSSSSSSSTGSARNSSNVPWTGQFRPIPAGAVRALLILKLRVPENTTAWLQRLKQLLASSVQSAFRVTTRSQLESRIELLSAEQRPGWIATWVVFDILPPLAAFEPSSATVLATLAKQREDPNSILSRSEFGPEIVSLSRLNNDGDVISVSFNSKASSLGSGCQVWLLPTLVLAFLLSRLP